MHCSISSVLFFLITFSLQNQVRSSPVVLWSNVNLPKDSIPLGTLSPLDLISNYICKLTNEQIQLHIVAVNDLSSEVIHQSLRDKDSFLSDIKKETTNFRYYPNVNDDIYRTFTLLPQSNNMKCSHIHFQLASSQTVTTLHDAQHKIQETIDQTGTNTNNPVLIVLVNHPTEEGRLSRQRRQIVTTSKNNIVVSDNKTCMFYANNLTWNDGTGTSAAIRGYSLDLNATTCVPQINATSGNASSATLNLVWVNNKTPTDIVRMTLIATIIGRYWYLTNATLNGSDYRYFAYGMHSRMDTPPKYSYVCTTATFVRYDDGGKYGKYSANDKFHIKHFQFQPFYANGSQFGPPNYCTSFFTSGIWMGITSSLLCLGILLFGIHRMMSIKSNDRYDDPKGKPLIIKAQE